MGELQRFQVEWDAPPDAEHGHEMDHMAGLVVASTVHPLPGHEPEEEAAARRIDLWTGKRPGIYGERPELGFVVQEDGAVPAADSARVPGNPLILTRGEPTEIVIHNRLDFPLSVHWHGLELPRVLDGMTVVVRGNRIHSVGADGSLEVPEEADVIDAAGRTLLPGLWDMHVHLNEDFIEEMEVPLFVAAGVTTVRDLGSRTDFVSSIRRRAEADRAIAPRILPALILYGPGEWGLGAGVGTVEEVHAALDRFAALGYVQVKIYNPVPPELVPVIVERARSHGMRVSGHIPNGMSLRDALEHGFDEIQHLFYARVGAAQLRGLTPDDDLAARMAAVRADSSEWQDLVDLLRLHDVVVDPTLAVVEESVGARPPVWLGRILDRFPPQAGRAALHGMLSAAPAAGDLRIAPPSPPAPFRYTSVTGFSGGAGSVALSIHACRRPPDVPESFVPPDPPVPRRPTSLPDAVASHGRGPVVHGRVRIGCERRIHSGRASGVFVSPCVGAGNVRVRNDGVLHVEAAVRPPSDAFRGCRSAARVLHRHDPARGAAWLQGAVERRRRRSRLPALDPGQGRGCADTPGTGAWPSAGRHSEGARPGRVRSDQPARRA